jgi:GNAT superfamily N-acetyltransferase
MVKVHNRRRKLTRCVSSVMDEARVTLRPVQSGDEGFIFRLFAGSRPGQGWLTGLSKEEKEGFLRQQFHSECESLLDNYPAAEFSIILLEGEPVGRFYLQRGKHEYRILAITLLPEHRGEGIGSKLLADVLQEASELGRPVQISVAWYDNPTRSLYERLGFRILADNGIFCEMQWTPANLADACYESCVVKSFA